MSPSNRRLGLGLQWKCVSCGRRGRVYEVFCANCWSPRAMLPLPTTNPLVLLEHPFFTTLLMPFAERSAKEASVRVPVLIDIIETALRKLQPVAVLLRDRLPNLAEVSAPQARQATEQIRLLTEVVLPWIEKAFDQLQTQVLVSLPDWTARTDAQFTAISLAIQGILDYLDALVVIVDRYSADGWQPQSWLPALQDLSRQLKR